MKKDTEQYLMIGGGLLAAYFLFFKKTTTTTPVLTLPGTAAATLPAAATNSTAALTAQAASAVPAVKSIWDSIFGSGTPAASTSALNPGSTLLASDPLPTYTSSSPDTSLTTPGLDFGSGDDTFSGSGCSVLDSSCNGAFLSGIRKMVGCPAISPDQVMAGIMNF